MTHARKMAERYCEFTGILLGSSGYLALVELAEEVIERCAKEAETEEQPFDGKGDGQVWAAWNAAVKHCAESIRALATEPIR